MAVQPQLLPIDSCHHHIVHRSAGAAALKTHNQRPPLLQMFFQVGPASSQGKNQEAGGFEVALHAGSEDAARPV